MIKKDIIKEVAKRMEQKHLVCSITLADEFINIMLNIIKEALLRQETIKLRDFGTFKVITKKSRKGRNPKTGQPIDVPEKNVIKFKTSISPK
jgi:nucleoid DNA-binding protein